MAKKKTPTRGTSLANNQTKMVVGLIAIAAVICAGVVYMFTGMDILGIFTITETPPVQDTAVAIEIPLANPITVTPPGSTSGKWWEVYFTEPHTLDDPNNYAGSIEDILIQKINAAKNSIHIAAFEFNLTPIADALIAAHKRGVDVRWITDDENGLGVDGNAGRGQFAMLQKAKIKVIADDRQALMHNKFIIFDNNTVWTGATNLTTTGIFDNNNNVIVIHSPELAKIFESQFNDMWNGEFGPSAPSDVAAQSVVIDGTPIQVYFSPEDDAMQYLIPVVQSAQKSIRFMAFSFTDTNLGKAVLDRFKHGVDAAGVFETRGSESSPSQLPYLFCNKVPVRQDGNSSSYHHKVFVIDSETLIVGSFNFSKNANTDNNENVLVIKNKDIAALYLQEFDRTWAEANAPDKNAINCK
jgi:phosphatidylserine/phosphatidylglycerophosphate/cardiolipin synthase-like enzyme